jgi:integrase
MNDLEYKILNSQSKKIYINKNLYLYIGKTKKTWYLKDNNTSKAIGEYPSMSLDLATKISLGKILPKTLKDLIIEFLNYKKSFISLNTYKRYNVLHNKIKLTSPLYYSYILDITPLDLIQYYKSLNHYEYIKRIHTLLKLAYDYAILNSYIEINPCHNIPISMILPKPKTIHMKYSIDKEFINRLLSFISRRRDKLKVAYTLLLLLALRVNTLSQLKLSMFDFKRNLLIIPAEIMKTNIDHILPINEYISNLVKEYVSKHNITEYLFPAQTNPYKHIHPNIFLVMLRKDGFSKDETTVHGFRSMLSTICNDNEIDPIGIEWYLAHYNSSSVSRAYNHSQGLSRKRKVLDFWFDYLFKDLSHPI